jgi:hypothetical protein
MTSYIAGDEPSGRVYVCHGRVENSVLVVVVMASLFVYEFVMFMMRPFLALSSSSINIDSGTTVP